MVIKYWAKVCGLTGSNQRLTTYSLVILIIFYLQTLNPPVLPSVAQLQRLAEKKEYYSGWECSFCDEEWKLQSYSCVEENKLSLSELLIGFFQFYSSFDYSNVICPLLGRFIPVTDFEIPDKLPDEMYLYKDKIKTDPKSEFRINTLLKVQDPFELGLNITRNIHEKTFLLFKKACKLSCELSEINDEASLLNSLFSIPKNSLEPEEDSFKLYLPFKTNETEKSSVPSENDILKWYELTTEAVLLVMKEVLKLQVDSDHSEMSSKIKKLESSKDVHSQPNTFKDSDDLVYICTGDAMVWNSRKKTSKLLNTLNISLSAFEKEVCISNAVYQPEKTNTFFFTLTITSFDTLKNKPDGIEIFINWKNTQGRNLVKELVQYLRYFLRSLILQAAVFIIKTKASTPVNDVKESLKELFALKFATLPDLKNCNNPSSQILEDKSQPLSEQEQRETILKRQNLLLQSLDKAEGQQQDNSNNKHLSCHQADNNSQSMENNVESVSNLTPTSNKDQVMKSELSSGSNIPNSESDNFVKPSDPGVVGIVKSSVETLGNNKFSDLLNTGQNLKSQSGKISEESNPFVASLEKTLSKSIGKDEISTEAKQCEEQILEENVNFVEESSGSSMEQEKQIERVEPKSECFSNNGSGRALHKPKFKPLTTERPKVYVERPPKYRKPGNHKPGQYKHQAESSPILGQKKLGFGHYGQQPCHSKRINIPGSSNVRPYHNEYIGNSGSNNCAGSERYQLLLSRSLDKHKVWYPTLFKPK